MKFTKRLKDIEIVEKEDIIFACAVSDPAIEVKWYKDDELIVSDHRRMIEAEKNAHSLAIPWTQLADSGTYRAMAGFSKSIARLKVKGKRCCIDDISLRKNSAFS